jgi:hypothetical protein
MKDSELVLSEKALCYRSGPSTFRTPSWFVLIVRYAPEGCACAPKASSQSPRCEGDRHSGGLNEPQAGYRKLARHIIEPFDDVRV